MFRFQAGVAKDCWECGPNVSIRVKYPTAFSVSWVLTLDDLLVLRMHLCNSEDLQELLWRLLYHP